MVPGLLAQDLQEDEGVVHRHETRHRQQHFKGLGQLDSQNEVVNCRIVEVLYFLLAAVFFGILVLSSPRF